VLSVTLVAVTVNVPAVLGAVYGRYHEIGFRRVTVSASHPAQRDAQLDRQHVDERLNIYRGTVSGRPVHAGDTAFEPALNYVDNTVQSGQTTTTW
jgi:hypothetical protein